MATSRGGVGGAINYYVEHKLCRVIVIAHDEKLVIKLFEDRENLWTNNPN